jgi:CubicO group peptidase (beta-lactamase class C family)
LEEAMSDEEPTGKASRRTLLTGTGALVTGAGLGLSPSAGAEPPGRHVSAAVGAALPDAGNLEPAEYAVMPITRGQVRLAVDSLDRIARDVMRRTRIPGMAVAVVHGGRVVYARGFGVRRLGRSAKVDPDTVFQIASVSKSVGATVVARAVGRGVVAWSDPVTKHLADFELSDPAVTRMVTIGDLYSHRSGIPGEAGDDLEGLGFSRMQIIRRLRLLPLNPFRVTYGYSNFGMTTAAEAVARAAGMPWERLSERLLYEPLGMRSTSSTYADFLGRRNRATIHARVEDGFAAKYIRDPDAQSPAGGVSSSARDMSRWMALNLAAGRWRGEQLIDPAALLQAHTAQIVNAPAKTPTSRSNHYGYGFNVEASSSGQVRWGHSGAFFVGTGTCFGMLPAGDVGIVVLTNAAPVGAAEAVAFSFTDIARTGRVERDWLGYFGPLFDSLFVNHSPVATDPPPTNPSPARRAGAYVGTYANEYYGALEVTARDGALRLRIGPKQLTARLRHYDGDTFAWFPPGGNGDPLSAVTFAGNPSGAARTVTLEFIEGYGFGTFTRSP